MYSLCVLSLLVTASLCSDVLDCNNPDAARTTTMKLRQQLLCNYDRFVRPVSHHSNKTTVQVVLAPRIIDFDDTHSILRVKTWLSLNWRDHLLTWDKLKYDKIDQLSLDSNMIWIPDLFVYNSREDMSVDQLVSPVIVDYQGEVFSFMTPELTGHCLPNWANWPFDIHVCTITLGSKRYLGSTVDYRFYYEKRGLFLTYLLPSKDWELLSTNSSRNETQVRSKNDTWLVSLNFDFTFRRHASVYIASYLVPGVVMVVLSLAVLWLPSMQVERVAILCTLVVIQSLYLQYLAYKIPSNGDKTPFLVCFYRDCLFLTGLLVIETIVTRSMLSWNSDPTYLHATFQFVTRNRVLQYIFVSDMDPKSAAKLMEAGNDEGSTLVTTDDNTKQWHMFVNIINKAVFIFLVPVYLLLSVSLLPLNYSFSVN